MATLTSSRLLKPIGTSGKLFAFAPTGFAR